MRAKLSIREKNCTDQDGTKLKEISLKYNSYQNKNKYSSELEDQSIIQNVFLQK